VRPQFHTADSLALEKQLRIFLTPLCKSVSALPTIGVTTISRFGLNLVTCAKSMANFTEFKRTTLHNRTSKCCSIEKS
jgi:hypothetical protein